MVKAYNSLVSIVNSFEEDELFFQEQAEPIEAVDDDDLNLPVHHPFGAYFSLKTEKVVLVDGGGAINKYYKPEYFDTLMKNWFPMAPFWSGLLLGMTHLNVNMTCISLSSITGDLQRHEREKTNGKQVLHDYNLSVLY